MRRTAITMTGAVLVVMLGLGAGAASAQCTGDCGGDDSVTVDEILTMVNIALGNAAVTACAAGDASADGTITVDEILTAVNNALNGCTAQEIHAFFATLKARAEAHDVDGFLALFAKDYMHHGSDVSQIDIPVVLPTIQTFDFTITGIVIAGDTAHVSGTGTVTFNNGRPAESWAEPDTTGDGPGFGWLKKTVDGWRIYGDQERADAYLMTGHNTSPGDDHYFFRARTKSSQPITSVFFSGPGIPDTALTPDPRWGGFTAFAAPSSPTGVGTEYSFTINFADGTQQVLHDTVKSWVPTAPSITITPGEGTATFRWTDVSPSVPGASYYWLEVQDDSGDLWQLDDLPLTRTSAVFNEDGNAQGVLESGKSYVAAITIFDQYDDYAYQRLDFTMP
jgi:hypothetical protein